MHAYNYGGKVCFVNVSTLSVLTGNLSYLRFPPVVNVH